LASYFSASLTPFTGSWEETAGRLDSVVTTMARVPAFTEREKRGEAGPPVSTDMRTA